jgi:hypothetical protein
VQLKDQNTKLSAMISQDGEVVPLAQEVAIAGEVEDWLGILEKSMRLTLDNLLKKTLNAKGGLDINNLPSQVCCLAEQVTFSQTCARAIKEGKLANYKQDMQKQLEGYTAVDN